MPSHRFTVLLVEDHAGWFTAMVVEGAWGTSAFAPTAAEALGQVEAYLEGLYRRSPWLGGPDFEDARLVQVKVEVRPEYKVEERAFPVAETLTVKVPCVTGRSEAGLLSCAAPTLGFAFNYYDPAALKGLVAHYVQDELGGRTVAQITRHLGPRRATLEEVVVQAPARVKERRGGVELPALDAVADPIGGREMRGRLSRPWQRDAEVARLEELLRGGAGGAARASVLLVGEGGVGKTAVLVEAARKVERAGAPPGAEEDSPAALVKRRFHLTSAARLIAGMKYLGMWQERLEKVIEEVSSIEGVLCVENLLDLLRAGGVGPGDSLAAFLAPYVARGEVRLVAEATPDEADACRRLLPGFVELFEVVRLEPMGRERAVAALSQVAEQQRQSTKVEPARGTVETVYRLFSRFMPYQGMPGKAAGFLCGAFEEAERERRKALTAGDAVRRFVRQTGLPELFLRDEVPLRHEEVAAALRARVIGQDAACERAAGVITALKAGLNDPARPVGVLVFAGPTGVGKTELARAMADYLFGHGQDGGGAARLVRLDMSEYAGPGASTRLLSSAADGGPSEWVRRVRQQPFCVLLLDEVEKAAPEVFDVLLNVFDEGRLTDRWGRPTTFRSAVIVLTTNLGAERAARFGLNQTEDRQAYESAVREAFRPEFFNRLDAVVTFDRLSPAAIDAIAEKELRDLAAREGLAKLKVKLTWTPRLVRWLAERGYDERYGARVLQRTIEQTVTAPLAAMMVDGRMKRGAVVRAEVDDNGEVLLETGNA